MIDTKERQAHTTAVILQIAFQKILCIKKTFQHNKLSSLATRQRKK